MHKYASASNESRELVSELEFVWDQVKSNVPSSNSSSPIQTMGMPLDVSRHGVPPQYGDFSRRQGRGESPGGEACPGMHVMSPVSKDQLDIEAAGDADEDDEFVDAPDSQADDPRRQRNIGAVLSSPSRGGGLDRETARGDDKKRKRKSYPQPEQPLLPPSGDEMWKKNISASIIKLTAELAAVREQLEARRLFTHTVRFRIFRFITSKIWGMLKHIAIDVIAIALLILWLRRRKDERLALALRVILGDAAAAQVRKLGDKQLGRFQLSLLNLPARKSGG